MKRKTASFILLGVFFVLVLSIAEVQNNNVKVCEKYWGVECSRYNLLEDICVCEDGEKETTKEMIDNYNQYAKSTRQIGKGDKNSESIYDSFPLFLE
jgi:hypothetical protein|tara:strand:- start:868 stop:1158 length:291 start_codon:yes stop_codon:yes gene_type:complete